MILLCGRGCGWEGGFGLYGSGANTFGSRHGVVEAGRTVSAKWGACFSVAASLSGQLRDDATEYF